MPSEKLVPIEVMMHGNRPQRHPALLILTRNLRFLLDASMPQAPRFRDHLNALMLRRS